VRADLRAQPFWTLADDAELNLFIHELVEDVHEHRQAGCPVCMAAYPPCPFVRAAVERVVEWRDDRVLRSRASWLRADQNRLEAGARS
jgi:hypothetical protein